ncbi:MAG: hypothetical protein ABIQ34_15525 [Tepidiformaceae bacterium]
MGSPGVEVSGSGTAPTSFRRPSGDELVNIGALVFSGMQDGRLS